MVKLAMDLNHSPELRGRMYAKLAQYVAAKRKAIEVTGEDGGPVMVGVAERIQAKLDEHRRLEREAGASPPARITAE
jgi:hypothetical protein